MQSILDPWMTRKCKSDFEIVPTGIVFPEFHLELLKS